MKNDIRWIRVVKAKTEIDNESKFYVQQVEYTEKPADSLMIFPYGIHANVPADAFGIMFSIQENPDNRGTIAWTPKNRPDLVDGEVAFYHPPTKAFLIWKTNGDLDIETGNSGVGQINIKSGNINIESGDITVTGDDVAITSPLTKINGNLEVTGSTALGPIVTSNGIDISSSHTHPQGVDSPSGDTQQNTGSPV